MTRHALLAATLLAACWRPAPAETAVAVRVTRTGDALVIRATPRPGTKINARLPPQLELASGYSVRLASSSVTADSAYFTAPPEVTISGSSRLRGALIRASVCDIGAAVCRVVIAPL